MPSAGMHFQLPIVFALLAQEALMGESTRSGRRQFLKHTAALAGVAVGARAGAGRAARSPAGEPEGTAQDAPLPRAHLRPRGPPRPGAGKRRRLGWFTKGRTLASSVTPFRWERRSTTFSWPTARMASRCVSSRVTRSG